MMPERRYRRFAPKGNRFPCVRYMALWFNRRVVRVLISHSESWAPYPLKVTSAEPNVDGSDLQNGIEMYNDARCKDGFYIPDMSFVKFYRTRQQGERAELERLHKKYAEARRELRKMSKYYKWTLGAVAEYKAFQRLINEYPKV